jgi:tRNA A37 threonylcarbamoyladenosine modification protein TsaB
VILVIQTNIPGRISVWFVRARKISAKLTKTIEWHGSDQALACVDSTLRSIKKSLSDVTGVIIVRGPGSFTAVRTGIIIANTLAKLQNIPIRGIVTNKALSPAEVLRQAAICGQKNTAVKPWYGKKPNITKPKRGRYQARAKR